MCSSPRYRKTPHMLRTEPFSTMAAAIRAFGWDNSASLISFRHTPSGKTIRSAGCASSWRVSRTHKTRIPSFPHVPLYSDVAALRRPTRTHDLQGVPDHHQEPPSPPKPRGVFGHRHTFNAARLLSGASIKVRARRCPSMYNERDEGEEPRAQEVQH